MDGISFLRTVKQNYIQKKEAWPINMSGKAFRYRDEGLNDDECLMIYKGWSSTIEIGSKEEFEVFMKVNNSENHGLLFCLNDQEKISKVVDAVDSYYITAQYEQCLDDLISALEPKQKLELKQ